MQALTGLGLVLLGGGMQGGFVLPMKYLRGWKWENAWFVYTIVNCLLFPVALLVCSVPSFLDIYRQTSVTTLVLTFGFGFGWGIGSILFGLGAAMLGMAVGIAIITAINAALGTLLPLLGRDLRHSAAKAERVLGWRPRPAVETIVDAAHSLVSSVPGR